MAETGSCFTYGHYIRWIAFHEMRIQDDLFSPYEITSQQARVLCVIHSSLAGKGSCCQRDLERSFGLRGSSVTSLLQGLERHGYIRRVSGQDDARKKQLFLTGKGEGQLETFLRIFRETEQKMVAGLSEEERQQLLALLGRVAENLEEESGLPCRDKG